MAYALIIEPNLVLARQYAEALKRIGHEAQIAHDAQAAINLTDKQTPDIVLLELLLGAHSGIEFLYEFRSYPEWQAVPVIICSRMRRSELMASEKVLATLGVVTYLYKPEISLKRLSARVDAALAELSRHETA